MVKSKSFFTNVAGLTLCLTFYLFVLPSQAENNPVIRPKIGLALGGGGARGAAHIGVLRILEKENIPVDYLVGTSAGALIAALYSGGVNPDELENYVLSGAIENVYRTNFSITRTLFIYINRIVHTVFKRPFYAGLYNDHKLHHFINQALMKNDGTIDLKIPLHIIAVDLVSGQPVVIKSGDVGLAVQASTAIPTLHEPIPINDQVLVDGGVLRNIPVEEAKKMGADIVIAIDVDSKQDNAKKEDFKTFEGIITRVISLGLQAQAAPALEKADIVISPYVKGIGISDIDPKSLTKAIQAGEDETIKMIPKIKKQIEQKTKVLTD